jgi:hypothetical protein
MAHGAHEEPEEEEAAAYLFPLMNAASACRRSIFVRYRRPSMSDPTRRNRPLWAVYLCDWNYHPAAYQCVERGRGPTAARSVIRVTCGCRCGVVMDDQCIPHHPSCVRSCVCAVCIAPLHRSLPPPPHPIPRTCSGGRLTAPRGPAPRSQRLDPRDRRPFGRPFSRR